MYVCYVNLDSSIHEQCRNTNAALRNHFTSETAKGDHKRSHHSSKLTLCSALVFSIDDDLTTSLIKSAADAAAIFRFFFVYFYYGYVTR